MLNNSPAIKGIINEYMPHQGLSQFMFGIDMNRKLTITDIPNSVMQHKVFRLFSSKELFKLRMVCTEWNDLIK